MYIYIYMYIYRERERELVRYYKRDMYVFFYFALYGSWEALDGRKILPRGLGIISTPGKQHSKIKLHCLFYISFFNVVSPFFFCDSLFPTLQVGVVRF